MLSATLRITIALQWRKQELSVGLILNALMLCNYPQGLHRCLFAGCNGTSFKKKKLKKNVPICHLHINTDTELHVHININSHCTSHLFSCYIQVVSHMWNSGW